jgi:hypothetical protein
VDPSEPRALSVRPRRSDDVALREFLELRINSAVADLRSTEALWEKNLDALSAAMKAHQAGLDTTRAVEAAELARRLDILNHAHERAVEVQQTYLRQDLYDRDTRDLRVWRETATLQLAAGVERGTERTLRMTAIETRLSAAETVLATMSGHDSGTATTVLDRRASASEVRAYIALAVTVAVFLIVYVMPSLKT